MLVCCFISAHRPRRTIPIQNHNAATTTEEKEVHVRNCDILIRERERARDGRQDRRGEKGKRNGRKLR